MSLLSYYNITNNCNRSLITVITLITRLENVMRDNEGSLIAARADRYYYSVSVFSYYNITNNCNRSLITVITL